MARLLLRAKKYMASDIFTHSHYIQTIPYIGYKFIPMQSPLVHNDGSSVLFQHFACLRVDFLSHFLMGGNRPKSTKTDFGYRK